MFTLNFWKDLLERAIKSGAQFTILAWVGGETIAPDEVNAWLVDWGTLAGVFVGGMVLAALTGLAVGAARGGDTASLVR